MAHRAERAAAALAQQMQQDQERRDKAQRVREKWLPGSALDTTDNARELAPCIDGKGVSCAR